MRRFTLDEVEYEFFSREDLEALRPRSSLPDWTDGKRSFLWAKNAEEMREDDSYRTISQNERGTLWKAEVWHPDYEDPGFYYYRFYIEVPDQTPPCEVAWAAGHLSGEADSPHDYLTRVNDLPENFSFRPFRYPAPTVVIDPFSSQEVWVTSYPKAWEWYAKLSGVALRASSGRRS